MNKSYIILIVLLIVLTLGIFFTREKKVDLIPPVKAENPVPTYTVPPCPENDLTCLKG